MKPTATVALAAALLCIGCSQGTVEPAKLRHLNANTLGAPVDDTADPLLPAEPGLTEPLRYAHRADDERYVYFELIYPKEVGFEPARASLNQLYADHEVPTPSPEPLALWKNRAQRFTIKLTEEDEGIRVQYDYLGSRGTE